MSKKTKTPRPGLPSRKELEAFLKQYDTPPPVAEVARAFHLRNEERRELRHLMREVTGDGRPVRGKPAGRQPMRNAIARQRGELPNVLVIETTGLNDDGELLAIPAEWRDERHVPPVILVRADGPSLGIGERALVKISRESGRPVASVLRVLPKKAAAQKILGIIGKVKGGALVTPVTRKDNRSYFVASDDLMEAENDELVEIVALSTSRPMGDQPAKVVERLGFMNEAHAASRIALHRYEIPIEFSPASLALAEAAAAVWEDRKAPHPTLSQGERAQIPPLPLGEGWGEGVTRTDLRTIPLVTIDGEDARDFDDAVFAEPDTDPKNPGGWHAIVAIADVAHYVRAGEALDKDAFERGNSVYFPDRVVPMLPEALSNGLCSLKPEEDRYCLAVHLWIDRNGEALRHQFVRGILRSAARLTYTRVQEIADGLMARLRKRSPHPSPPPQAGEGVKASRVRGEVGGGPLGHSEDGKTARAGVKDKDRRPTAQAISRHPERSEGSPGEGRNVSTGEILRYAQDDEERLVANLYGAYEAFKIHIENRGPLDLNLPEHKVRFDAEGNVREIYRVQRLDSHRLIEAFMIAANVAAAETITKARMGAIFRVHEAPDLAKITTLKEMLKGSAYHFNPGGAIEARMFNKLLRQAEERNEAQTIHTSVLRSQMQAYYAPQNVGHFGLALSSYAHFTSPIRRYSDLIVHRALIRIFDWGDDGIDDAELKRLSEIGEHISVTERRAMQAEREAMERYVALYMADHVGADFPAHISGVTSVGLFVELDENGAQGFIPRGYLGDDFFQHDERRQQLVGRRTKRAFRLGQPLRVVLDQADTLTGSLRFALPESARSGRSGAGRPAGKGFRKPPLH